MTRPAAVDRMFVEFLSGQKALIAESTSSNRQTIRKVLMELGMKPAQILVADTLDDGISQFHLHRPRILFSDYLRDRPSAFDLFRHVKDHFPNRVDTALFLTAEFTGSMIQNKAEDEEVDAFIPRPFNLSTFREKVEEVLRRMSAVTPYCRLVGEAHALFQTGENQQVIPLLVRAKLSEKNAYEAWTLEGRTYQRMGHVQDAIVCFKQALKLETLYYPAMSALFRAQLQVEDWSGAESTVSSLLAGFVLRPRLLPDLIRFSIHQGRFEEILAYHDTYSRLDETEESLVQAMAVALLAAARFFLGADRKELGTGCVKKALTVSKAKPIFVKEALLLFLRQGMTDEALTVIGMAPDVVRNSPEVRLAEIELIDRGGNTARVVDGCLDALKHGARSVELYSLLIQRSQELGRKREIVEEIAEEAARHFPNEQARFKGLLSGTQKRAG